MHRHYYNDLNKLALAQEPLSQGSWKLHFFVIFPCVISTVLYIAIRYSVLPPPLFNHAHRLSDSREILINIKHFYNKLFILLEGIQFISSINKCLLSFKKSALLFIENRKPTSQEWFLPVVVLNHSSSKKMLLWAVRWTTHW